VPDLVRFHRGETIYCEGEPAQSWFIIELGVARTCRFYISGHRQLTGFQYPGDVLGFDDQVHDQSAEAVTDVTLRRFKAPSDTGESPASGVPVPEQALRNTLENAVRCVSLFGRRTADERVAAFILMIADRSKAGMDVELPMCRSDIADYLGLTIHTVSRTFTQLSKDGLIAIDGAHRCRILDLAGLSALAGRVDD
jgi:CRP-like cAMP-binding protein